jgi:hypothetical protein
VAAGQKAKFVQVSSAGSKAYPATQLLQLLLTKQARQPGGQAVQAPPTRRKVSVQASQLIGEAEALQVWQPVRRALQTTQMPLL